MNIRILMRKNLRMMVHGVINKIPFSGIHPVIHDIGTEHADILVRNNGNRLQLISEKPENLISALSSCHFHTLRRNPLLQTLLDIQHFFRSHT